ncbi:MAG: CDP-alcohol phosphatidyltransferase family protein [Bacteroidia bacterium]
MIKKHIPNFLTCCNLLCGCLGILFTASYQLNIAFYLILAAAAFDFFDGFAARLLKVNSPIGKDLDSLADVVTFGVLPGFIMYKMISLTLLNSQIDVAINVFTLLDVVSISNTINNNTFYFPFIAFIIPVFSALRLAKFNNDTRQTDSFIGVNTPANTLLISSLGYIFINSIKSPENANTIYALFFNPYTLIVLTILMSYLLIAELPLFALKFKKFGWAENKIRYIFLIITTILLILFQFYAFPFIIFLYIAFSIVNNFMNKRNKTVLKKNRNEEIQSRN